MSFLTIENNVIKRKEEEEDNYNFCFVCHEINIPNEETPLDLKTQKYYIKNCECGGLIHKFCLDTWHSKRQSCPICRNYICDVKTFKIILTHAINNINNINSNNNNNNNNNRPTLLSLFYIKKRKYEITKTILICSLLFCIYNFYVAIIKQSYIKK
jgi:hypothetical protein